MATAPADATVVFSLSPSIVDQYVNFDDGLWSLFAVTIKQIGSSVGASVVGSNDTGFASPEPVAMWVPGSQAAFVPSNVNAVGTYAGSSCGFKHLRLHVKPFSGSTAFTGTIHMSAMPALPPVVLTSDLGVLAVQVNSSSGTAKSSPGNFHGAHIENTTASTVYFNLWDGAIGGSGTLILQRKVAANSELDVVVPEQVLCPTNILWNVSDSRTVPGTSHAPATDIFALIYYS